MKICTLTNTYNSEEYLWYLLKSIYDFSDRLVTIDGAFNHKMPSPISTDQTDVIVRSFPDPKKKIVYRRESANSQIEQRSKVFKYTKGFDWLFLIDDDEIYKSKDLKRLRELLVKARRNAYRIGGYTFFNSFNWYRYVADPRIWRILPRMQFIGSNNIRWEKGIYDRSKMVVIPEIMKYHYSYVRSVARAGIRRAQTAVKHYPYTVDKKGFFVRPGILGNLRKFTGEHPEIMQNHPYRKRVWDPPKIKSWDEYYTDWHKKDYERHIKAWKGLCHRVARLTPKDGKILEVGSGTGMMSIYLSSMGFRVIGTDSNPIQVKRAINLAKELDSKAKFKQIDLFSLEHGKGKMDTAFSQGLLEHYSDQDIERIINKQFEVAKVVVFSVPLDKFGHRSRGDERLLPENYWRKLIQNYKILHWSTFSKDKQLICAIRNK